MDKETILNYIMDTPENTNRAVLSDMLDEFNSGSGGGGGGLYVETELDGNAFVTTTVTISDVIEALGEGSSVVFHIPAAPAKFVSEAYLPLLSLSPNTENTDELSFDSKHATWIGTIAVLENGKISIGIYID